MRLSLHDPEKLGEKYVGESELWLKTEQLIRESLQEGEFNFVEIPDEAAFYGPKIDFKITDAIGRSWQCTTVQFDFNLPEQIELTYQGADGLQHRPYMVHRAILGSIERFLGVLIEHYGGSFPFWFAKQGRDSNWSWSWDWSHHCPRCRPFGRPGGYR